MESHADFQHTPSASAQSKTANKHGAECLQDERRRVVKRKAMRPGGRSRYHGKLARNARKGSDEKVMMTWPTLDDIIVRRAVGGPFMLELFDARETVSKLLSVAD